LNATKLDKIFAKPFLAALDGHVDGVYCSAVVRNRVTPFISGACDGEVRVWDLTTRSCVWNTPAHTGFVRGIAADQTGNTFYTCGDDKYIKQWTLQPERADIYEPLSVFSAPHSLTGIDHHWVDPQFATSGETVCVWDGTRTNEPLHTYKWGADAVLSIAYNPAEACLLGSTASDRSVVLYDLRAAVPMRKFVLSMKSNKIAWNPREPMNFTLANEDNNLYTFDMRNLQTPRMIHKDHVSAVMDVAYSPTGREFVSGGYDRTVRIFNINSGRSRDLYHTKRMQRVFSVQYSVDSQYVISGSDDTNIRIWKTNASKALGTQSIRKEKKEQLQATLKKRYGHMPEIARITRDVPVPKSIKKAVYLNHVQKSAARKKNENRKRHRSDYEIEPERKKVVLREYE
jgi:DDB1- and CUL4-associated factor 13